MVKLTAFFILTLLLAMGILAFAQGTPSTDVRVQRARVVDLYEGYTNWWLSKLFMGGCEIRILKDNQSVIGFVTSVTPSLFPLRSGEGFNGALQEQNYLITTDDGKERLNVVVEKVDGVDRPTSYSYETADDGHDFQRVTDCNSLSFVGSHTQTPQ